MVRAESWRRHPAIHAFSMTTAAEGAGIQSLLFECGLSLQDVAVSVVGKYRYQMLAPREHDWVPLLVDIILVGRTKIITLHSGMWLDNRTDKNLTFRLHVPVTPLTAPAAGGESGPAPHSDAMIGPVQPDKGAPPPTSTPLARQSGILLSCFRPS